MSNLQELKVSERDTTVTTHQLRTAGYIPATVYGHGMQSQSIQVRSHEFYQSFLQGNRDFQLNGFVSGPAKVKHVARNSVTHKPITIEFCLVTGTEGKKASKEEALAKV